MEVTVDLACGAPCFADVVLRGLDDFVAILMSLAPSGPEMLIYNESGVALIIEESAAACGRMRTKIGCLW